MFLVLFLFPGTSTLIETVSYCHNLVSGPPLAVVLSTAVYHCKGFQYQYNPFVFYIVKEYLISVLTPPAPTSLLWGRSYEPVHNKEGTAAPKYRLSQLLLLYLEK